MSGIKKILAATDFSRGSDSALRRAVMLAKAGGAEVAAVHAGHMRLLDEAAELQRSGHVAPRFIGERKLVGGRGSHTPASMGWAAGA